ncbi:MAG: nucleoside triphosphate pyrophosphohydrolase [Clostridia bacterium]|nr:nucleoside triphosphate pyrophosphohydrolase [Clostridia bacterium]
MDAYSITVVGLGHGNEDDLTLGALRAMKGAKRLILRTSRVGVANLLREEGIAFTTLDDLYENAEDFDALDEACAQAVLDAAKESDVVFAVFDPSTDGAVERLRPHIGRICAPAMPAAMADTPRGEKRVVSASDLKTISSQGTLILTEINDVFLAGTVKMALMEFWPADTRVRFYPQAASHAIEIPLEDLDRQRPGEYGHLCTAALLPMPFTRKERCDVEDLFRLMEALRAPGGCPWDREQTHRSLRNYLIEEAYETAEAVDKEEWDHVAEELGDVLLQVIFQADIGRQYGNFDLGDVTSAIVRKMVKRHPHVFGNLQADTGEEVSRNWDAIKRGERHQKTVAESMRDLPASLPSLMRAEKLQGRAARAGYETQRFSDALLKVRDMAKQAEGKQGGALDEAMGDLLFSAVQAVRLAGLESEACLQSACRRYLERFEAMEQAR